MKFCPLAASRVLLTTYVAGMIALAVFNLSSCRQAGADSAGKIAALKDALKDGVITQQEYDAKVAQLPPDTPSADPQKKAALDKALKDGLLTQAEYDAKVKALGGAPTTAAASSKAPSRTETDVSKIKWTTISVVDPVMNMAAFTVTVPADWTFEGAVLRRRGGGDVAAYVYRASSPDGLTGVQMMPRVDWHFAKDPRAIQNSGTGACNLHPPLTAMQQAADIAAKARPNPKLGPVEKVPTPKLDEFVQKTNQQFDAQARSFGKPNDAAHLSADAARVRLKYDFQGHPEEETFLVTTQIYDLGIAVASTGAYGIIQPGFSRMQNTQTSVSASRAPEGHLESSQPLFDKIGSSVKLVPEYDQAMMALAQQRFDQANAASNAAFAQVMKNGRDSQERLMSQHNSYMAWQQQRRDSNNRQFQADTWPARIRRVRILSTTSAISNTTRIRKPARP